MNEYISLKYLQNGTENFTPEIGWKHIAGNSNLEIGRQRLGRVLSLEGCVNSDSETECGHRVWEPFVNIQTKTKLNWMKNNFKNRYILPNFQKKNMISHRFINSFACHAQKQLSCSKIFLDYVMETTEIQKKESSRHYKTKINQFNAASTSK